MAIDPNGKLWVVEATFLGKRISRWTRDGKVEKDKAWPNRPPRPVVTRQNQGVAAGNPHAPRRPHRRTGSHMGPGRRPTGRAPSQGPEPGGLSRLGLHRLRTR